MEEIVNRWAWSFRTLAETERRNYLQCDWPSLWISLKMTLLDWLWETNDFTRSVWYVRSALWIQRGLCTQQLRPSNVETPERIGIVLLDEIEKAGEGVVKSLYQVIDKAEWTNKKLAEGKDGHTEVVPCFDIIFIITTNVADKEILDYAKCDNVYTAKELALEEIRSGLERKVRSTLQTKTPFHGAFVARVGGVVPFQPMSNRVEYENPLLG